MAIFRSAAQSHCGRVRRRNEDRWYIDDAQRLFIVSDGIGGHTAGELASQVVVEELPGQLRKALGQELSLSDPTATELARDVVATLSRQFVVQTQHVPGLRGLGATLVFALIHGHRALVVHLGDSRAYRLRGQHLEQLTSDHTVAQILVDDGTISPLEATGHPTGSRLTRYVGMPGTAVPDARFVELRVGDRLLLCTDGLTNMVGSGQLATILGGYRDPCQTCCEMVRVANAAGGKDNITVIVVVVMDSDDLPVNSAARPSESNIVSFE